MIKAILSKKDLSQDSEYISCILDLLNSKAVQKLECYPHHIGTSRFQHSLNVSYYNFKLCRFLRLNSKAAARAGLLHDLFYYDRKTHEKICNRHPAEHANIALYNASMQFSISELEGDMILNHMWPITPHMPRHAETFVITLVDKFCACAEVAAHFRRLAARKIRVCSHKPKCPGHEAIFSQNQAKNRRSTVCTSRVFNEVMRKIRQKTGVER